MISSRYCAACMKSRSLAACFIRAVVLAMLFSNSSLLMLRTIGSATIVVLSGSILSWHIAIPLYQAFFMGTNPELAASIANAPAADAAFAIWGSQIRYLGGVNWTNGWATQHSIPVTYSGKPFLFTVLEGGSGGVKFIDVSNRRNQIGRAHV